MTRTLFSSTLLLLAGACTPPVLLSPAVATIPAATSAPLATPRAPTDPTIVSVTAVSPPARSAVDGDLAEWGCFVPAVSLGQPTPGGTRAAGEPAPNPPDAVSRLAFALTGDGALIAADLGEPAREGVWLGIGAWAPDLPRLGVYSRGGVLDAAAKPGKK